MVAVVPARNEGDLIDATVRAVAVLAQEVVVVDDFSTDATASIATAAGAKVVGTSRHLGKGGALELGISMVEGKPDLWIFADADLGSTAAELATVLEAVRSGGCDLAIAVLPRQGGGFGVVKRAAALAIRMLGGLRVDEPLSGQRALTAEALAACRPLARGFGVETAMTIDAARLGLRVLEVPSQIMHRASKRDLPGFLHRGRQGRDILRAVTNRMVAR